ncbi:2Fe-2S iron-sulfur cluster-binding protein [Marinomonas balearica]|uniref:2Fe-2S iron-sulfur cluster protein n=1 Tax=Marinomonas balearica TaxID=491947 RepID=A0A4R6MDX8_9GAMM|nr:2Fe-2S iron-sulfur cluster-binding protein [Marinomonas balearica]TDO99951.1 2Fe-2S iron-sulfur cluster protein [Marinomonas balearica]
MEIKVDGKLIQAPEGENLLSLLLENGVDIAYGCRAGACCSCSVYDLDLKADILACQTQIDRSFNLTFELPKVESVPVTCISSSQLRVGTLLTGMSSRSLIMGEKVRFDKKMDVWVVVGSDQEGCYFWSPNHYASALCYSKFSHITDSSQGAVDSKITAEVLSSANDGRVLLIIEPVLFELSGPLTASFSDDTTVVILQGDARNLDLSEFKFQRFQCVISVGERIFSESLEALLTESKVRAEHLLYLPLLSTSMSASPSFSLLPNTP